MTCRCVEILQVSVLPDPCTSGLCVGQQAQTLDGTLFELVFDPSGPCGRVWVELLSTIPGSSGPVRLPVRLGTTGTILLTGLQVIDGVLTAAGDRVLVKDQTPGGSDVTNGIYLAEVGAWVRAPDANSGAELEAGTLVVVTEGTTQHDTIWEVETNDPITIGVTPLEFRQMAPEKIEDEGVPVATRPILNFIGAGVTATDDPANDRVNVTVTAANLTNVAPVNVDHTAAAVGVATDAARSDHKHDVNPGVPVATAQANAQGTATTLALSDHVHRTIVQVQLAGVLTSSRPTLDFTGAAVTVTDDAGGDRAVINVNAGAGAGTAPIAFGTSDTGTGAITTYLDAWSMSRPAGVNEVFQPAFRAGTLKNLRIRARTGPVGGSVVFTLRKNGVDTAITATLLAGGTTASDLVDTVAVAAGDDLSLRAVKSTGGAGGIDLVVMMEFTS